MFFLKFRVPIIIILIGITAFLGLGLTKMTKENGMKALMATNNKEYIFFEKMEEEFSATDQLILGITFVDSVYTPRNLKLIQDLSTFLEEDDNIVDDDVLSISSIDNIDGKNQELVVAPIIPEDEIITSRIAESVKLKIRDNDMLKGKIVSTDEKSSVIIVTLDSDISFNAENLTKVINRTQTEIDKIKKSRPDVKIYRSGMVSVKHTSSEYMDRDMKLMFPIAIGVVMFILLILLRSLTGFIIPLLVTLFSVVWTLGLKGWLGSPLTVAETAIPIMLIAIGCADGVHIVSEFLSFTRGGEKVKDAISKTMKNLTTPVILTSITTSLGFLSLITAPGVSVRNMGVFLGFGVLTAMLFSLLFIPAILSFKKDKKVKSILKKRNIDLSGFGKLIIRRKVIIVISSLLFLGLSITGMKNVKVETDQIMFLKETDPLRLATKKIQESLGGINTLDIIIEGSEDSLKKPETLNFMNKLQNYALEFETVSYTISLVDYIKKIYYEFMDKDEEFKKIPKEQNIISNLLFLYEMGGGDSLDNVVVDDYSMGKVSIRLLDTTQAGMELMIKDLDLWIEKQIPAGLTTTYTNDYMRVIMGDLITKGQIRSFISTLVAILFLLMIIFRSPIAGILIALPVVIAVCFNFAVMWLTGTTLNIGTSIIASVGMGVGIDYAIHFFQRYKKFYLKTGDNNKSIILAFNESATPIISNALAVGIGFLTLLFSNYFIIAGIGWITGLSMLTTALCALFVLPAYLAIFEPLKKRERNTDMKKKSLIAIFLITTGGLFASDNAYDIMQKNDVLKSPNNSSNITTMVLINKKGKKKVRKMEMYVIDTEIGEDTFIDFLLPADVKGTKFLTTGDDNGDDDQRLFLPALNKIRKISSSNKNGKFMGSDITYYDMENKNLDEFDYEMLREESINGINCWVVVSIPKDSDAPYSKVNTYVSKEDYFVYKREMFDKKDRLIKTFLVLETKKIDGVILPVKTVVDNTKDNHKTLLSVTDISINSDIQESIFTIKNLK